MDFDQMVMADNAMLLDAFGSAALFKNPGQPDIPFQAIYNAPGKEMSLISGQMETTTPAIICFESFVSANAIGYGSLITVSGTDYMVSGAPSPDGAGLVTLTLTKDF